MLLINIKKGDLRFANYKKIEIRHTKCTNFCDPLDIVEVYTHKNYIFFPSIN